MLMRGARSEGAADVLSDGVEEVEPVESIVPLAQPDKARIIKSDARINLKFILYRTSSDTIFESELNYSSVMQGHQIESDS